MPNFLIEASYTAEGAKGLACEGGSSRHKTVEETVTEEMDTASKKSVSYRAPGE